MNTPDDRIFKFIKKHHVFTLATTKNNKPWCCNCFYAFDEKEITLIFTSDDSTRHTSEMVENPYVSGSIVLETSVLGKIQGIQFEGKVVTAKEVVKARTTYLNRFPFAALIDTTLWALKVNYIKMTDNRLGFGKKIIWQRAK